MSLALLAAFVGAGLQKPLPNNAIFPDVPDNHFVYGMLSELKSDGLLPELVVSLSRGNWPTTRGQVGQYIAEATVNLQRYVDAHRTPSSSGGLVTYSVQFTNFSGDQLKYLVSLTPRMRRVAKTFAGNLPAFVSWKDLDLAIDQEGKLIDGLLAGQ